MVFKNFKKLNLLTFLKQLFYIFLILFFKYGLDNIKNVYYTLIELVNNYFFMEEIMQKKNIDNEQDFSTCFVASETASESSIAEATLPPDQQPNIERRRLLRHKYKEHGGFKGFCHNIIADVLNNKFVYICLIPIVLYFVIFNYLPMAGLIIAFEDFKPRLGIFGSDWVGWQNFEMFFSSIYFGRLMKNTILLSLLDIVFCFPAPIIFALLLNEVRNSIFKRTTQTISYLPYFISVVIVCGIFRDFTQSGGPIATAIGSLIGNSNISLIGDPKWSRAVYVIINLWQGFGYGSIIYISTLSGTDMELYEAAALDGANRWQQTLHITLPAIKNMILLSLILKIGAILAVATDKILLLYSATTYETLDTLGTYIYRIGITGGQFGLTAAVGLFNSVIGLLLLVGANYISKKIANFSLF